MNLRLFAIAIASATLLNACGAGAPADIAKEPANPTPATTDAADVTTPAPPDTATPPPVIPTGAKQTAGAASQAPPATPGGDTAADTAVDDAIDSSLGDHQRYRPVIDAFQAAVAADDAAKVAALVHYPIGVDIDGKPVVMKNEQEFVARYAQFMTPDIRDAIVGTKYADLFVNYKGIMFGSGQAWINGICKDDRCKEFEAKVVTLQHGPE